MFLKTNEDYLSQIALKNIQFLVNYTLHEPTFTSIVEKCFDIWDVLKMAAVKSVEPGSNSFSINHIIRCKFKFFTVGIFKICPLVLIL